MNMVKESIEVSGGVDLQYAEQKGSNVGTPSFGSISICPVCAKLRAKLAELEKLCEVITQRNMTLHNRLSPSQKRKGKRDGT